MIQYKLPRGHYIRQLDCRNWIVATKVNKNNTEKKKEHILGYFPELDFAWYYVVKNLFPLLAETKKELSELVKELQDLSEPRSKTAAIKETSERVPKMPAS